MSLVEEGAHLVRDLENDSLHDTEAGLKYIEARDNKSCSGFFASPKFERSSVGNVCIVDIKSGSVDLRGYIPVLRQTPICKIGFHT